MYRQALVIDVVFVIVSTFDVLDSSQVCCRLRILGLVSLRKVTCRRKEQFIDTKAPMAKRFKTLDALIPTARFLRMDVLIAIFLAAVGS